jgi:hypothetical protein
MHILLRRHFLGMPRTKAEQIKYSRAASAVILEILPEPACLISPFQSSKRAACSVGSKSGLSESDGAWQHPSKLGLHASREARIRSFAFSSSHDYDRCSFAFPSYCHLAPKQQFQLSVARCWVSARLLHKGNDPLSELGLTFVDPAPDLAFSRAPP